ncbi:type II restriction endonuclease subunit M [Acinetobacter sp.]|uniref:type II restriction endonuclease subunit M n=1 Tax=Acinetobacter sp. TaxID=472 RepID=UPI0035B4051E
MMSYFLRLLSEDDKANALSEVISRFRTGEADSRTFSLEEDAFDPVPGKPFSYWVTQPLRNIFQKLQSFGSDQRVIRQGLATADDFRFVRSWWESSIEDESYFVKWFPFAKGGSFSPFYADIHLLVNWEEDGAEVRNNLNSSGAIRSNIWMMGETPSRFFFKPGLTWSDRTSSRLSVRPWPAGGVFSVKGSAGFFDDGSELLSLALMNSTAFNIFLEMLVNAGSAVSRSYQVGIISTVPFAEFGDSNQELSDLALRAWSLKRSLDTTEENSHAFLLPMALRSRIGVLDPGAIELEFESIQSRIDSIVFDVYGFSEPDRNALTQQALTNNLASDLQDVDIDDDDAEVPANDLFALLSWAVGVGFSRFDWRLATGERAVPPEPGPFDPLPAKSPGMLPDGAEPFHAHGGILVDDQGHPHDLARLVEEVLGRVDVSVPDDVRRWLQRDFFAFHFQRYSKSRRKAPIYWPLSTASGSYTLWVYYPSLNNQTLFTAVNDFLDGPNGKLTQVSRECAELRIKGSSRSRDEEKQYETLQAFEQELTDLRDTLLKIAPTYQPNHDDGVQITAAPLWPLFRHKPWQKVLKDTWTKLEKGDYDWAHLAMAYWPERVSEKCKTDKSLAIAHGLEDLYVEPEVAPKKTRGKKNKGSEE